jgi:hypothetical protein
MSFAQRLRKFRFDRPQRIAAALLLLLFAQCYWVTRHQTLTERDYQYARCGREMWEKPSPLAGYFTSCGNIHDGTLAYRAAGLPLTIQRILAGQSSANSPWELRHQLNYVLLLMRLPFILCGLCLGAALWWVTRRLFGNEGAFVALALYCFSPEIVRVCTYPNAEILAAFGFFAAVYTAILLFASYAFRPDAFSYVFRSGAARMWFSLGPAKIFFSSLPNVGITLASGIALLLFFAIKRSRYFGNFAALLVAAPLLLVITTGVPAQPWLWGLPFLLTFIGGVFADALETPQRRIFLVATGGILVMQAGLCLASLPRLAK